MKNLPRLILAASACASALLLGGCPWDQPQSPSLGGFFVFTEDDNGFFKVPHPGAFVNGSWRQDLPGTVHGQELNFDGATDSNGVYHVLDGRIPAVWDVGVIWNVPCGNTAAAATVNVTPENPNVEWVCAPEITPASPQFSIFGQSPSTITIGSSGLSLAYGLPQLNVYDSTPKLVSQSFATSVSPDGTAATFPFPKITSSGASLPSGVYGFNLWNKNSSGTYLDQGVNFLSVGSSKTSLQSPYGVDAADVREVGQSCYEDPSGVQGIICYPFDGTAPYPVVTLSLSGKVQTVYGAVTVGSTPTAIKVFGTSDVTTYPDNYGGWQEVIQPSSAIVTNFGSNTVSILDIVNDFVTATISVGAGPITVILNSNSSKAYVANYNGSTVSEIDLTSNTQTRVGSFGAQPEALAMDPSGTALWVGGANYISKVSLSNFTSVQSISVSGQVASLAVSAGQNCLVYTTMATSGSSTTFQAQQAAISSGSVQGTYTQESMSSSVPYAEVSTSGGPAPGTPGWHMVGGALVSANYGNGIAVIGTPAGFAVLDLAKKTQIMQGNTPSAVRGIATDASQGIVYVTAPDSNSYITIPLPPQN